MIDPSGWSQVDLTIFRVLIGVLLLLGRGPAPAKASTRDDPFARGLARWVNLTPLAKDRPWLPLSLIHI